MRKPIIGVTPDFNPGIRKDMGGKEPTYFLRARYLQAIQETGGVPLVLPLVRGKTLHRRLLHCVDGILVTGSGWDLNPELYGERQRFKFQRMSEERAQLELGLSKLAFDHRIPILGICGGMQSMNVALGGTLIQDIPSQLKDSLQHSPPKRATKMAHAIRILPDSHLHRIARAQSIQVNSSHHQSVKAVPSVLRVTATSSDGVIEALEASEHPFWIGVQWHPEFLYRNFPVHKRLFSTFVQASQKYSFRKGRETSLFRP